MFVSDVFDKIHFEKLSFANTNMSSLFYCLKLVSTSSSVVLQTLSTKALPTIKLDFTYQLLKAVIAIFMFSLKN